MISITGLDKPSSYTRNKMDNAFTQAKNLFNQWTNGELKLPEVLPAVKNIQPVPKAEPKTQVKKLHPISRESKDVHRKLVKKAESRNPGKPTSPIKKVELERTKIYWDALPTTQLPIVRGASALLGVDPYSITTNRAEAIKWIIEEAVHKTGSSDERQIFQWIKDKMREGRISGDRPEAQLRIYLRMI